MNAHLLFSSETVDLPVNAELAAALTRWRLSQQAVPTPEDAIYQLLTESLERAGYRIHPQPTPPREETDPTVLALMEAFKSVRASTRK